MRHWQLWMLVAMLPVLFGAPCDPIETPDATVGDGGTVPDGGMRARDVTFGGEPAGEWGGATIDGVLLTVGPWRGGQTVEIVEYFGEGQDVLLTCGTLTVQPPETHGSFSLIFNDAQDALLVDILDHTGTPFTDQPINTLTDAQAVGITSVGGSYKMLTADAASSTRPIGGLVIASCAGFVHEVTFE